MKIDKKIPGAKTEGKSFKGIIRTEIAKIGKALSDPTRIEILEILSQGEHNVEQVTASLKSTKGTISHHLQILKAAGMVEDRKESRYVFYSMPPSAMTIWNSLASNSPAISAGISNAINLFFEKSHEFINVSYRELRARIRSKDVILVDVRPEREFLKGHFPGAISLPLDTLELKIKELPGNKKIIAYCRGPFCIMAENAVIMLRAKNIQAFRWKESVHDWRLEGIPLKTG